MAEPVKFIEFKQVPDAPRIRLPANLSQEEIKEFLKSEQLENAMFERGFMYKYGLQPVNMLEAENLDDGSFHSSFKGGMDSLKAIGQGALSSFYDFVGAKEHQEEALQAAEQYLLDRSAHIFQRTEDGELLARPSTIEDIVKDDDQLTAFTKYLKYTSGNAAATTIPTIIMGIVGGAVGSLVGPGGTVAGATAGTLLSGYIFGLGDTTLAQREAGVEDPNVGLSLALAVPYAAVERLGIGGVVPSLIRTFGTREAARQMAQKGMVQAVKNGSKGSLKRIPGTFAKEVPLTMLGEGLAEGIQETLNRTAAGVSTGVNFNELYNDKEFAKQLGEAAAAGFFGGFGFGMINPTYKSIKMLGKGTGPVDAKGGAAISNLDPLDVSTPIFEAREFDIGSTVTVDNQYNPDIPPGRQKDLENMFDKPKFKVVGTADLDGEKQFILSQVDIPAAIATVPIRQAGLINQVDTPTGGAEPGDIYEYDIANPNEQVNVDAKLRKQYSDSKKALEETGYIPNSKDESVDTFLGGRENVINELVNRIEVARAQQQTEKLSDEERKEFVNEYGYEPYIDPLNPLFKKYDKLTGEDLKKAVTEDYTFWRDLALIDRAEQDAQQNQLTEEDRNRLQQLGYLSGPRGQEYIQRQIENITPVPGKKKITEGRRTINDIIKNNRTFSTLAPILGGPVTEKIQVGETVRTTAPLTAAQKASITGDKIVPVMRYHPLLLKEEFTFEDLYEIPSNERMRMVLQLADALDSTGIKRKYLQQYKELRQTKVGLVNAARAQFGILSDAYKEARQELKDFDNTGEHIVRADKQMGDIKETFRLFPVFTPQALRAAARQLEKIRADSKYRAADPNVRAPLVAEEVAYKSLITQTFRARKDINKLLQSLSIEPILDTPMRGAMSWETVTLTKVKKQINKLRKQLNQTETQVTRRKIYGEFVRFNKASAIGSSQPGILTEVDDNLPLITELMREWLDQLGLSQTDLAIVNNVMSGGRPQEGIGGGFTAPEYIRTAIKRTGAPTLTVPEFPNLTYGLIQIAFNMDMYQNINERIIRNNYANPALRKTDMDFMAAQIMTAFQSLNHEAIHALKNLGLFTDKEWNILTKAARDQWINEYGIKDNYTWTNNTFGQTEQQMYEEEGIAYAFANFALQRKLAQLKKGANIDNTLTAQIKRIFVRIKAFLMALANGLRGAGFETPESIFNKIEAGLVGQRMKVEGQIAEMSTAKSLAEMTYKNPRGDVVLSRNLADYSDPTLRNQQKKFIEFMLGERIDTDTTIQMKFSLDKNKIRFTNRFNDKTVSFDYRREKMVGEEIGLTQAVGPEDSMYTYMSPQQYLDLTMPLQDTTYDKNAVKFMTQAARDGRVFGVPDLIIELSADGKTGRVVGQEGRHRAFTAQGINGTQSTLPVAIRIIHDPADKNLAYERSGQLTQNNKRTDPVNKKLITTFLTEGMLEGMDRGVFEEEIVINKYGDRVKQYVGHNPTAANFNPLNNGLSPTTDYINVNNQKVKAIFLSQTRDNLGLPSGNFVINLNHPSINKNLIEYTGQAENNIVYKGVIPKEAIISKEEFKISFSPASPTIPAKQAIATLYESFETTPGGDYQYTNEYINLNQPNPSIQFGDASYDPQFAMNRQERNAETRKATKAIEMAETSEPLAKPGRNATPDKMSLFARIMAHARSIAKRNTPFTYLYNTVMDMTRKNRSLQQQFTDYLRRNYMNVIQDDAMKEALAKAMIIAQMTDAMNMQVDPNGRLTFIAPEDGGAADLPVKKGEVVVLEGDVAQAFIDVHKTFQDINKEWLKAEIAREHVPNLIMGINLLKRFFPQMPELKTLYNFEGMDQQEIANLLEQLDYTQIKFIVDSLSNIMIMRTSIQGDVLEQIQTLLGNKDAGLNALLSQAGQVETLNKKMYVPLMRFGQFYISVSAIETDEKGDESKKLLWYQQFETMGEAQAALPGLRVKYPEADISAPSEMTIDRLRQMIQEGKGFKNLEYLAQFMSDTNAESYQLILKELREVLAKKGLDKDVLGLNQFYIARDKSVGAEGVPGYSADFPRSIMQYIMVASQQIARNRYAKDKNKYYDETRKWALDKGDNNLLKFAEKYYGYVEDPVQEFAQLRRIGFWWYLGGNLSSAVLQTMSLIQFTGPILSQLGGTVATLRELRKAFAHASGMVVDGVSGQRQYQDAFIDFNKLPEGDIKEALFRAIADGTIKQGQALQEAGITPGMGGSLVGSQRERSKTFRWVESVIVGGAFNTFEAASRITAFIAAYNLAKNDPKVLEKADLLYGDDMDYQRTMEQYGRSPEALARFMTEETFGIYGKENRQQIGRGLGSLPALFMTYMTQMVGLLYRLLNPPVLKRKAGGGFTVGVANPTKTKLQNRMGRRAFARIMLMMLVTGGVMGLPGGEDAEDLYDLTKKMITGLDSDVRTEFRNMLYEAGWGPGLINAVENGLINSTLGWDVQRRVGFGVLPWSQQVRAGLNMLGIPTGARAEEFLGAPGSVYVDAARGWVEQGLREQNLGKAIQQSLPTAIRNMLKAVEYSSYGNGFASTSYGQVLTQDIKGWEIMMQAFGFAPASIAKQREAIWQEGKLDKRMNLFRQRKNAQISNAYRSIIIGGMRYDADMVNEGQQELEDLMADIMDYNSNKPPQLVFIPDLSRLYQEAMKAVHPEFRISQTNKKLYAEKKLLREALGLD